MPEVNRQAPHSETPTPFALLGNFLPLLLILTMLMVSLVLAGGSLARFGVFIGLFYLLPPLLARLLFLLFGKPRGRNIAQRSRAFRIWWLLLQLQMPFNRLPWLEEMLRLVPGLYPLWLNLWGARVHPASFWGPGALMLDRPYLEIGAGCVIGSETLMSAHLARREAGRFLVDLDDIAIGAWAVIGARSSIGPGCVVAPGETLAATTRLAPYNHYKDGKRQ